MPKNKSNNYGITSLVLGISSTVLCWVPLLGIVAGILGIVFSQKQKKIFPNNINTAGLVTSIIGLTISVIYNLAYVFVLALYSTPIK